LLEFLEDDTTDTTMFIDNTEFESISTAVDHVEDADRSENEMVPSSGTVLPAKENLDLASGPFVNFYSSNL